MKSNVLGLLKTVLWGVCAFHVLVGLSLNLPLGLKEWVASGLYGARVDWSDSQFVYILKPLGAFMIALGFMAGIAASNPLGNRAIIYGFAVLFILRGLQRIVFLNEIQDTFAIAMPRHFGTMIIMFLLATTLLVLARASDPRRAATGGARA